MDDALRMTQEELVDLGYTETDADNLALAFKREAARPAVIKKLSDM